MTEVPPELRRELDKIWAALMADVGAPKVTFIMQAGTIRAFLQGNVFVVPASHAKHFERFGTIPTSLVRDAAYEAKKRQVTATGKKGASIEADALAYAEVFLRAAMAGAGED
jgi:hypothetical protein